MSFRLSLLVAVAWCGFGCATVKPGVAAGPAWWSNPSHPPSLADKHVVFVAGHLNEFIPGYFTENAAVAQELGAGTSILAPPSVGNLDADVSLIEQELRARVGSKAVLFGHSRGGASVLLTVLRRPSLILSGQVDAVIVVQGALGGSPLADLIAKVKVLKTPGLASLTTEEADRAFTIALTALANRLTPEEWDQFFARIFYVRSEHRQGRAARWAQSWPLPSSRCAARVATTGCCSRKTRGSAMASTWACSTSITPHSWSRAS